jgi:signal transduction histidine kinase
MTTPRAAWVVPAFAVVCTAGAAALFLVARPGARPLEIAALVVPAAAAAVALLLVPFTRRRTTYYGAQVCAIVCYHLTIPGSLLSLDVQLVLLTVILVDLVLSEPYPLNLAGSALLTLTASVLRALAAGRSGAPSPFLSYHVPFLVPGLMISFLGSLMTRYREMVVDLTAGREKLTEAVVDLARANTVYQDYAVDAGERATVSERQRVTRDIHDIVGYTLTNNMMLMEAAMDLMKENALALPAIIETARSNAQEGLEQVRSALYRLRDQESGYPVGLAAIARLVRVFEQATAIRIRCDFSNMPQVTTNKVDSAVYHLVQEALVNAFRHGRASEVSIRFWYAPDRVRVAVRDNGSGGAGIVEGIGLRGMRERMGALGGVVKAQTVAGGFSVSATIPLGRPG